MIEVDPDIVDELQRAVGDRLRSVAIYDPDGYTFEHLREDIRRSYSDEEIEAVFDDLVVEGISSDFLEGLYHAGRFHYTIHGFEDAVMLHFPANEFSGVFVSIESDADVNLKSLVPTIRDAIESTL